MLPKGTDLTLGELHVVLETGHWDGDGETEWTWQGAHPSGMLQAKTQVALLGKYGGSRQRKGRPGMEEPGRVLRPVVGDTVESSWKGVRQLGLCFRKSLWLSYGRNERQMCRPVQARCSRRWKASGGCEDLPKVDSARLQVSMLGLPRWKCVVLCCVVLDTRLIRDNKGSGPNRK